MYQRPLQCIIFGFFYSKANCKEDKVKPPRPIPPAWLQKYPALSECQLQKRLPDIPASAILSASRPKKSLTTKNLTQMVSGMRVSFIFVALSLTSVCSGRVLSAVSIRESLLIAAVRLAVVSVHMLKGGRPKRPAASPSIRNFCSVPLSGTSDGIANVQSTRLRSKVAMLGAQ